MPKRLPKDVIGWEEWIKLPSLGLPAIKAKSDTGARTSSLHAFNIVPFEEDGVKYVRFNVNPIQRNYDLTCICTAKVKNRRFVTSSNGEKERRYVITTDIVIGDRTVKADLTLTNRHKMTFKMLLGLETIKKARLMVDPALSCTKGKIKQAETLYLVDKEEDK
jgi:ribosomal protein S6--L-glutamate ligase